MLIAQTVTAGDVLALLEKVDVQNPVVIQSRDIARCTISRVDKPETATRGSVSWLRSGRELDRWTGSLLLVDRGPAKVYDRQDPFAVIEVSHPRTAMLRVLRRWFCSVAPHISVHRTAAIHASAVLGAEGFGYSWTGGHYEAFPNVGGVVIGADVDVGPCATIMRGCVGATEIGRGSKVGPGVHIGRGARVGEDCLIAPHVTVGGSAVIGDRAKVWMSASIGNGVKVGAGAVIGMGAAVLCDVPPGETWAGVPARRIRGAHGN